MASLIQHSNLIMSFSKFCQEKARSCLFYETDFSTYQADPFFGTWVPVGTIFAITAPVYLFLKKKGFIHLGVIFESLISSLRIKVVDL